MGFADGTRLGPYRIVRRLGKGGMGEVYEAIHEAIERRVAIKVRIPRIVTAHSRPKVTA